MAFEKGFEIQLEPLEQAENSDLKLPDDSGEKCYNAELPDDSGEDDCKIELPNDSGENVNTKSDLQNSRPLNENERALLKDIGMTDANIEKCTMGNDGIYNMNCINKEYAGKKHPDTGVMYKEKIITIDNVQIRGVFPEFSSIIDINLPDTRRFDTEGKQFTYLNNQLREAVKNNPELQNKFTDKQLAQIERGIKPTGYTWHHNEEVGKMQLVRFDEHNGTKHTGGNSIWSNGT